MDESVNFTGGAFYQANFDSRVYIETFYTNSGAYEDGSYLSFFLQRFSDTFSSGKYKGQRLIDVGSAASIHSVISACPHFDEIILSDFTDSNRTELNKWLHNAPDCFDWTSVIQQVCLMEKGRNPVEVEALLRQRVKSVLKCDVLLDNPFHPLAQEPADCVITSLCLEMACKDLPTYRAALRNVTSILKPGGTLVMVGTLGETFYIFAGKRYSALFLTRTNVEEALGELKLSILDYKIFKIDTEKIKHVSDYESKFYLVARKAL